MLKKKETSPWPWQFNFGTKIIFQVSDDVEKLVEVDFSGIDYDIDNDESWFEGDDIVFSFTKRAIDLVVHERILDTSYALAPFATDEEITPDVEEWLIKPLERNLACVVSEKHYGKDFQVEVIDDQISPYAQGAEIIKFSQLYETKFIIDEHRQHMLVKPNADQFLAPLLHATFLDNDELLERLGSEAGHKFQAWQTEIVRNLCGKGGE